MEEMTDKNNFNEFVESFLNENCVGNDIEITILTDYFLGGSIKIQKYDYFSTSFGSVAYLNENGKVKKGKMRFKYFLNNGEQSNRFNIKDITPYVVKCRKFNGDGELYYGDGELYYVLDVTEKSDIHDFDRIIEKLSRTETFTEGENEFVYNKKSEYFTCDVNAGGKKIHVRLTPKHKAKDVTKSLETYRAIMNDFDNLYKTVVGHLSEALVEDANDWREEGDDHEITQEEIVNRIDKDEITLYIDDTAYTFYFEDDYLFDGHCLVYDGDIESDEYDAYYEG